MIGALIALISLDVTEKLIGAGIIAATLTVAGATTATPVVVTTSAPHGYVTGQRVHGLVSSVGGMPELDGMWEMTPLDTTRLSLATYTPAGAASPSVGAGTFTSGGTIQVALPDGRIRIGKKYRTVHGAPPRITFSPLGSPAWNLNPYGGVIPPVTMLPRTKAQETSEQLLMRKARQLATEFHRFEVYVWGAMNPPDPDFGDYDITQAIRNQIIESTFRLCAGRWRVDGGSWTSQDDDAPKFDGRGQEYKMLLVIEQPVTALPLSFVPASTIGTIVVNLAGAASGDQTVIEVP